MGNWKIHNNNAIKWANEYEGDLFHALLTDAPYHLTSIVKRYSKASMFDDTKTSDKARRGVDSFSRLARGGFMGQTWDGGDIAFRSETWDAFKKVLYPGAFGMAFSASRNWHRMAVAIEDAGFIIHPTVFFLWVQGQGFPKATKIRDERFKGHKYGLQALKPAVEPIIVFQKPYESKPVHNILETGAGALNIDGARIPLEEGDGYTINTFDDGAKPFGNGAGHKYTSRKLSNHSRSAEAAKSKGIFGDSSEQETHQTEGQLIGRYPSNLVLDELIEFDKSKFFHRVSAQLDEADPFYYCAKVSPKERNGGLDDLEDRELGHSKYDKCSDCGEYIFQSDERDSKCVCESPQRVSNKQKNPHPTLKPINLIKYLATLLLPPSTYAPRRLFVPFSGVASEMIGGLLAGWDEVEGVEFDTENGYVDIANKRLEYWCKNI